MRRDKKKHEVKDQDYYIRRDKRRDLMLLPLCVVYLALYVAIIYFILESRDLPFGIKIRGDARLIWYLSVLVLFGLATILFTASLSVIIWMHLMAIHLKAKANSFNIFLVSLFLLLSSFFVSAFATYVESIVRSNYRDINKFLRYDLGMLWDFIEIPLQIFCIIAIFFIIGSVTSILILPFYARKNAEEYIQSRR